MRKREGVKRDWKGRYQDIFPGLWIYSSDEEDRKRVDEIMDERLREEVLVIGPIALSS